jgi:hypothetical protein
MTSLMGVRGNMTACLCALTALLALTLAACGGDDEGGSPTPSRTGPTLEPALEQQLRELLGKWTAAETKITYNLHSVIGSQSQDGQLVYYQQPPSVREDIVKTGSTTAYLVLPETAYACAAYPNVNPSCAIVPADEAQSAIVGAPLVQRPTATSIDDLLAQTLSLAAAPEQQVLGRSTTCITMTLPFGQLTTEATGCFTDDGLLLSETSTSPVSTYTLTATQSEQPQQGDFEAPYPIVTAPPSATQPPAS